MRSIIKIAALTVIFFFVGTNLIAGDTGTYKIQNYEVKLTPYSDGKVGIEYHQKWLVKSGHIPWITVGMANSNFDIAKDKIKGAVKKIGPDGSYVRIDLDRDYKPGESFEVFFFVTQHQLFYADKENYKLDFTPGWYDQAETGKLGLEVFFFAKVDTIKTNPKPVKVEGQKMIWEKSNLKEGEKFSISVSFPKKIFSKGIAKEELDPGFNWVAVIIIIVVVIVVILIFAAIVVYEEGGYGSGYGSGGNIFFGGSGDSGGGGIFSGGGGGFGGRSSSCACACVSCACACACAGGGGAGCDRKQNRRCSLKMIGLVALVFLVLFSACSNQDSRFSTEGGDISVPKDDPVFTPLKDSWVIDNAGVLEKSVKSKCHQICQKLQDDGIAEVIILIQSKVNHPVEYSTHYGRWLKLGKKGLSAQGGNNGLVWLIRPDKEERMTYSIGRGLPKLTSSHMTDIIGKTKDYLNFNNFDQGILVLASETDKELRNLYTKGKKK